jgi:hypothetical protein
VSIVPIDIAGNPNVKALRELDVANRSPKTEVTASP